MLGCACLGVIEGSIFGAVALLAALARKVTKRKKSK